MGNNNYRTGIERKNRIEFGDRIFARLSMGGKTIVEFMISRVADMSELLGELRHLTHGKRGLAKLYIRNQSRGWSLERPLMLYAPTMPNAFFGSYRMTHEETPAPARHMPFPWETH